MDLVHFLIWLIVFCLIAGLVIYALQLVPLPQPLRNVVIIAICLILVLVLLNFLGVLGAPMRLSGVTFSPSLAEALA